jgi:hypothetical protein
MSANRLTKPVKSAGKTESRLARQKFDSPDISAKPVDLHPGYALRHPHLSDVDDAIPNK